MRNLSWLRAALLPALAFTTLLVASWRPEVSAQAGSQQRTLFVSALDKQDVPVTDLGPDAFIVKENGVQREVLRVSPATEPIDITVMVDNSDAAKDEITFFRSALPPFLTELATRGNTRGTHRSRGPSDRACPVDDRREAAGEPRRRAVLDALQRHDAPGRDWSRYPTAFGSAMALGRRSSPSSRMEPSSRTGIPRMSSRRSRTYRRRSIWSPSVTFGENSEHSARERNFVIAEAPQATGGRLLTMLAPNALADESGENRPGAFLAVQGRLCAAGIARASKYHRGNLGKRGTHGTGYAGSLAEGAEGGVSVTRVVIGTGAALVAALAVVTGAQQPPAVVAQEPRATTAPDVLPGAHASRRSGRVSISCP